jgi:hypothetical protein
MENERLIMLHRLRCLAPFATAVLFGVGVAPARSDEAPSVRQIAAWLPSTPCGPGRPIEERSAWERLASRPEFRAAVRRAEALLDRPIPPTTDALFLDFSRTGNRKRWERIAGRRRSRIGALTLAECLESRGRFLPALTEAIEAVCAEPTWVMPAHDRGLGNFRGERIDIDLGAAHLAWNLALAEYVLRGRLDAKASQLIRSHLSRRIFEPYSAMLTKKRKPNWWLTCTNNWNAVCLAGVTGSALAVLETREQRARFVAAACKHSRHFLRGFTPDGYCSEGLGYWGYGFGYYVLLAESIRQATGGKIALLTRPAARAPATFADRIEIVNGVSPAFADCGVHTRPAWRLTHFLRRRLGLGGDPAEDHRLATPSTRLAEALIYSFPNGATEAAPPKRSTDGAGPRVRCYFESAGVLVCRPQQGKKGRFGAALKGGHNAEHHNHNDVGSYVVVVGERPVLVDPGSEVYTARTFSRRRYESKVLNSYGHPVPVPADRLQRTGRKAAARVLDATRFTEAADTFALDLRGAYGGRRIKKLTRTFVFSRVGNGALTVTDTVAFSRPEPFETALITLGDWLRKDDGSLFIWDFDEAVEVKIEAGDPRYQVRAETLDEDVRTPTKPTRIAIRLARPVKHARIRLTITPSAGPGGGKGGLRNGDFEAGDWCWRIPDDGMAAIGTERAFSGSRSLKITDRRRDAGSDVTSARVPVNGHRRWAIRGRVFGESGDRAVGLYVKFRDAAGSLLNRKDRRGHIAPVGVVGGSKREWEAFRFPFRVPGDAATLEIWIHSMNGAEAVAWLDALELVKE